MPKVYVHLKNGETLDLHDLVSVEIPYTDKPRTYNAEQLSKVILTENMFMLFECSSRKISMRASNILYIEFLG